MNLLEHDWEAISKYTTPKDLKQVIKKCSPSSLESLNRCRSVFVQNMFSVVSLTISELKRSGTSNIDILIQYLSKGSFIPYLNIKRINNCQFGYVEDGEWKELPLPRTDIIRDYWNQMTLGSKKTHEALNDTFQEILLLFPGKKVKCKCCEWTLPITDMHDENCVYCENKIANLKLEVRFNRPMYVETKKKIICN